MKHTLFLSSLLLALSPFGTSGASLSINAKDNDGNTSLHRGAKSGDLAQCVDLLSQGAQLDTKGKYNHTPLYIAAENGKKSVCQLFLLLNANIEAKDNDGYTPLIKAAYNGKKEVCELLIKHKANIKVKNNDGYTPLIYAARNGKKEVCELLIKHKVNIEAKDNKGKTALDVAKSSSYSNDQTRALLKKKLEEAKSLKHFLNHYGLGTYFETLNEEGNLENKRANLLTLKQDDVIELARDCKMKFFERKTLLNAHKEWREKLKIG